MGACAQLLVPGLTVDKVVVLCILVNAYTTYPCLVLVIQARSCSRWSLFIWIMPCRTSVLPYQPEAKGAGGILFSSPHICISEVPFRNPHKHEQRTSKRPTHCIAFKS